MTRTLLLPSTSARSAVLAMLLSTACGWQNQTEPNALPDAGVCELELGSDVVPAPVPRGLRVVGNRIEDGAGEAIVLRGVNRSGSEYQCVKNNGIFDGLVDETSVRAMMTWGINAVRIPLNEACWAGKQGVAERYAGENYKAAIKAYVALLESYGVVPILDLHWAAPGDEIPRDEPVPWAPLRPMPNADNSVDFWRDVATTFLDDDAVVFEPYNEPFPDLNDDSDFAWQCWRDGCEVEQYRTDATYAAVGMQTLVNAIRETGSRHLVLLGGVQYSNNLSQWLAYKPSDPLDNLAAAWHVYDFNRCSNSDCWEDEAGTVALEYPIVATEIGQSDCEGETFLTPLMQFLDDRQSGYLAWTWNEGEGCIPREPGGREDGTWSLVTSLVCPEPNSGYARTFRDHLLGAAP